MSFPTQQRVFSAHRCNSTEQDVVTALSGLDGLIVDNTKHTRQNLRSQVEQRALQANKEFLSAFEQVYQVFPSLFSRLCALTPC